MEASIPIRHSHEDAYANLLEMFRIQTASSRVKPRSQIVDKYIYSVSDSQSYFNPCGSRYLITKTKPKLPTSSQTLPSPSTQLLHPHLLRSLPPNPNPNPALPRRRRLHRPLQLRLLRHLTVNLNNAQLDLLLDQLRDAKQIVHLLETHALRLRDDNPDKDEHAERKTPKNEVRAVAVRAHRRQHVGHRARNHKIEEPLRRGREGDVGGAEARGRDLRDVDPADGAPAELEEGGKEEDADEGDVALGGHGFALDGRVDAHVQADVEHGEALGDGGPEEGFAAPQGVGGQEEEAGAGDGFDDAVDAGGEEAGGLGVDAQVGEDEGRVVVDGVGAGHLLADHEEDADEGAVAVAGDGPHLALEVPEGGTADEQAFLFDDGADLHELVVDVGVGDGEIADTGEGALGAFPEVLLGEETGGFVAEVHRDEEKDCREALHGERDDVLGSTGEVDVGAVVDPEGEHDAGDDEELIESCHAASNGSWGVFGDV